MTSSGFHSFPNIYRKMECLVTAHLILTWLNWWRCQQLCLGWMAVPMITPVWLPWQLTRSYFKVQWFPKCRCGKKKGTEVRDHDFMVNRTHENFNFIPSFLTVWDSVVVPGFIILVTEEKGWRQKDSLILLTKTFWSIENFSPFIVSALSRPLFFRWVSLLCSFIMISISFSALDAGTLIPSLQCLRSPGELHLGRKPVCPPSF